MYKRQLLVGVGVEDVTSLAPPAHLGHFVVEETSTESTSPVLEAEPLEWVRLLALSSELLGGPLGLQVEHGVVPSLAGVGINVPAVLVLVLSPVGNAESLEDGSGASVEADVSDTLEEGVWVEILGVHVMHHVRLLVELVAIHILNAKSYIIIKIKISTIGEKHDDNAAGLVLAPVDSLRMPFACK